MPRVSTINPVPRRLLSDIVAFSREVLIEFTTLAGIDAFANSREPAFRFSSSQPAQ